MTHDDEQSQKATGYLSDPMDLKMSCVTINAGWRLTMFLVVVIVVIVTC